MQVCEEEEEEGGVGWWATIMHFCSSTTTHVQQIEANIPNPFISLCSLLSFPFSSGWVELTSYWKRGKERMCGEGTLTRWCPISKRRSQVWTRAPAICCCCPCSTSSQNEGRRNLLMERANSEGGTNLLPAITWQHLRNDVFWQIQRKGSRSLSVWQIIIIVSSMGRGLLLFQTYVVLGLKHTFELSSQRTKNE